jgi:hypothetical protein
MINNGDGQHSALDTITRITPILWSAFEASMTSISCVSWSLWTASLERVRGG